MDLDFISYTNVMINKFIKRMPEELEFTEVVGESLLINEKNCMSFSKEKLMSLLWTIVLSVVVSGGGYILGVGDLWAIDYRSLTNIIVLTGFSTIITSIKLIGTNENTGKFLGTQIRKD